MDMLDASRNFGDFSLLGGPLHRVGTRLGLVRGHTNTFRLGLAIGFSLWVIGAGLAVLEGRDIFGFDLLGAHVRLLLVIPLMFAAEALLDPRQNEFLHVVVRSRVVPGAAADALLAELARLKRYKDAWLPDALCLGLALAMGWLAPYLSIPGLDRSVREDAGVEVATAGWWYSVVCLTAVRFLLLRWIWRMLLWLRCLFFLSRLPLRLVPAHADGMAGLGGLPLAHMHFAPLVLALSAMLAASFAVDIANGSMPLRAVYPAAGVILLVDALLFVGPLLLFAPRLWACKVKGIGDYMVLSEAYASAFDTKWLRGEGPGEALLGTSDIGSLADLTTAVGVVQGMRIVPATPRLLINLALMALLPLTPLILFKYPLAELAAQILGRLTGL
jgi:hypothetical protein